MNSIVSVVAYATSIPILFGVLMICVLIWEPPFTSPRLIEVLSLKRRRDALALLLTVLAMLSIFVALIVLIGIAYWSLP